MANKEYCVEVTAESSYVEERSNVAADVYVFSYCIRLTNSGTKTAQLISRHWFITEADGKVQEVRGMGVVGENPRLEPGQSYEYSSWSQIGTPFGTMKGSYQMLADDGQRFEAEIPEFQLVAPRVLH